MGRSPPNIVGSKSPIARSSIFLSPLTVLIVVPFRKQFGPSPDAQPIPTGLPFFPQFAEAGSVFDTFWRAANDRIAPIFMMLASALNFLQVVHGDHTSHSHTADYCNALPNAIIELQFCCDFCRLKPEFLNKRPSFYATPIGRMRAGVRELPTAVLASENGQSARFPACPV